MGCRGFCIAPKSAFRLRGMGNFPTPGLHPRIVGEYWGRRRINPLFIYYDCPYYRSGSNHKQYKLALIHTFHGLILIYCTIDGHPRLPRQPTCPSQHPAAWHPLGLPCVEAYNATPHTICIRRIYTAALRPPNTAHHSQHWDALHIAFPIPGYKPIICSWCWFLVEQLLPPAF